MTVEASFVIPVVICTFVLIIYFANHIYTACILGQDSYVLAFRASRALQEKDPLTYVGENSTKIAGKKYFGSAAPTFQGELSGGGKTVTVTGNAKVNHGAMGSFFLKPLKGWELSVSESATRRDYAAHARTVKRLKDIVTEIKE